MISRSRDRLALYCQICILLICAREIRSEDASVNKEDLREEHLLPVRMTREAKESAFEGSGDDNVAILPLRSRVMERLTLDDNKVEEEEEEEEEAKDDSRSKETAEDFYEGSGLEETPAGKGEEEEEVARNATAAAEDKTTTESAEEEQEEEEEEDSSESSETTTVAPETETVKEVSLDVSTVATTTEGTVTTETAPSEETTTTTTTTEAVVHSESGGDTSSGVTDATTVESETTVTAEVSVDSSLGEKDETETTTAGDEGTTAPTVETSTETEVAVPDVETKAATTTEAPAAEGGATESTTAVAVEEEAVTLVPETHAEPEPEPKPQTEPETESDQEPEPESELEPELEPITEPEPELEPITELVEVKHVKEVLVAPETPKEDDAELESETTTVTSTSTTTTTTTTVLPVAESDNATLLENENLTAGMDTLHMKVNSRLLDSSDTVVLSPKDPSRLGTYIVISLILLSFLSLTGFILMKRRVQKRRKQANMDQENLDTEKALLSLSEYKDHPDGLDEGKMRNNEITPLAIKSNAQINKFEKNTNFSSPKNLNTKANEKNMEKDNVLKKASDNLTQVIIEDPSKDVVVDDDKTPSSATEKLIVRTHIDQDSIPKKPVIVNGITLVPVTQD